MIQFPVITFLTLSLDILGSSSTEYSVYNPESSLCTEYFVLFIGQPEDAPE